MPESLPRRSAFRGPPADLVSTLCGPFLGELDPRPEAHGCPCRLRPNEQPPLHRSSSGQIEDANALLLEQLVGLVLLASNDEVVLVDADAHRAVDEKGN